MTQNWIDQGEKAAKGKIKQVVEKQGLHPNGLQVQQGEGEAPHDAAHKDVRVEMLRAKKNMIL